MARVWLVALLVLIQVNPGYSWSSGGHAAVGVIAFQRLSPETRGKVLELLKKNPVFARDFALPPDLRGRRNELDQEKWLFGRAGQWPDVIRGEARFDRPKWHFINLPFFFSAADESALSGSITANVSLQSHPAASLAEPEMNVVQVIRFATAKIGEEDTSDADKGILLAWLFHTVGDIHQPCHGSALFSRTAFPTGDRGGNSIPLKRGRKLHAFWDGLLGDGERFNDVQSRVSVIMSDDFLMDDAADCLAVMDPADWAKESLSLSKSFAYHPNILQAVQEVEDGTSPTVSKVSLPANYRSEAGEIAKRRIAEAGFRLAKLLEDNL